MQRTILISIVAFLVTSLMLNFFQKSRSPWKPLSSIQGEVEIQIPSAWRIEQEDEETVLAYDPKREEALRLTVRSYKANGTEGGFLPPDKSWTAIDDQTWISRGDKQGVDGEIEFRTVFWQVVSNRDQRVKSALFSYTFHEANARSEVVANDLAWIESQIRDAKWK